MAAADEFGLIARYFAPLATAPEALGLTDDAAFVPAREGHDTIVTTDCMVSGVHFLDADGPDLIARKLLRVNLSDVAAMAAQPVGYLLALALPRHTDESWIAAFTAALADDQRRFGLPLLGGDTTATDGGLVATITAFGHVPKGKALRRNGARAGDLVLVSGTIGDAALGLAFTLGRLAVPPDIAAPLLERLHLPTPRLDLGWRLAGLASAGLDVSDGLAQDVGHIARTSGVQIRLDLAALPLSATAAALVAAGAARRTDLVSGGDDYELALTAAPDALPALQEAARAAGVPLTVVGRCVAGEGVVALDGQGVPVPLDRAGYTHF
jgi:thiamine-monophosphate kinase